MIINIQIFYHIAKKFLLITLLKDLIYCLTFLNYKEKPFCEGK
jgi:hypothetical protein